MDNILIDGNTISIQDTDGNLTLTSNGTGDVIVSTDLVVSGDLTVQGTTTTLDTETLVVEDKNIELGVVTTPTDITADGGGITLKGDTDKIIAWANATDSWDFNQNVDVTGNITGSCCIR